MPFQILMAFHFLDSRKRRMITSREFKFSGSESQAWPRRRLPGAPAERVHLVAVTAVPERRCRRAPARPRRPAPSRTGAADPRLPGRWAGRSRLGSEVETEPGRRRSGSRRSHKCEEMALAHRPPLPNFVGRPGAGLGKGPLSGAELLGGDSGPFATQPLDPLLGKGCQAPGPPCRSTPTARGSEHGAAGGRRWGGGC